MRWTWRVNGNGKSFQQWEATATGESPPEWGPEWGCVICGEQPVLPVIHHDLVAKMLNELTTREAALGDEQKARWGHYWERITRAGWPSMGDCYAVALTVIDGVKRGVGDRTLDLMTGPPGPVGRVTHDPVMHREYRSSLVKQAVQPMEEGE